MKAFPPFSDMPERPELFIQMTGAALVLTAAVCFFAWNWQALPQAVRLILPGACMVLSLLAVPLAEARQKKTPPLLPSRRPPCSPGCSGPPSDRFFKAAPRRGNSALPGP